MNDRNYYRQCDNETLLVLTKEGGDNELAFVLAERLADALFTIEHADRHEIADLNAEINDLKEELAEANQTIRYLENELENVK